MANADDFTGLGPALGLVLGVLIVALWVGLLWGVRLHIFPRVGVWSGENYWIGSMTCGNIDDYTHMLGFWDAYSDPPIWVGFGGSGNYRTKQEAMNAVEKECR